MQEVLRSSRSATIRSLAVLLDRSARHGELGDVRRLLLRSDPTNAVVESVESNNDWPSGVALTVQTPDLVPTAFSASTGGIAAGQSLTVSFTVKNQGSGPATGSWIDQLWLSADGVIDNPGDVFLRNVGRRGPLAAGATYAASGQTVTIPAAQSPGTYYLLLRVDTTNAVTEPGAEGNNDWPEPLAITVR